VPVDWGAPIGQKLYETAPSLTLQTHDTMINEILTNLTTNSESLEPSKPYETPSTPAKEPLEPWKPHETPRTPAEEPGITQKLQLEELRIDLGYLGIHEKPEELRPPVVYGKINGHNTQIMLDSGCSTYVLSTDFVRNSNISYYLCKPIPVELAV